MTQSEYAKISGLTRARVSQMVAAGMPLDSKELADQWRTRNVKGALRRDAKAAVPNPMLPPSAMRQTLVAAGEGPYRPPEAEAAPIDSAKISDDTPQGAYERQRKIERAAYGLAARALNERRADAKHLVAVHAQAARNLAQLRLEILAVAERERSLVSGDWVRKLITDHDGAVVTLVKAMPKQLAGRIAPHDPDHAETELNRWVQEVFLKTLHNTNPFTNEQKHPT